MKTKKVQAHYYKTTNTIKIKAKSTDFYPQYLKYIFEYLKVPQDATIVFIDKTIEGGIKAWLKE